MKNKSYIITYDKYIPNKYGGASTERVTICADTKDIAVRRMKEDVYKRGIYSAYATAKLPDGTKIDFKPRKQPNVTSEERILKSRVLSRGIVKPYEKL